MSSDYLIIPGTQKKLYDGTIVILNRLPGTKWILHCGIYDYNGKRRKGWYFASIPSDTMMPVFEEDLLAMRIIDETKPCPGHHPHPPVPPTPPAPLPIIFTPKDKEMIERSTITLDTLEDRDKLDTKTLIDGKVVRVNDNGEGQVEYYEWSTESGAWAPATLGYRYLTRDQIDEKLTGFVVDIAYSDEKGALVLTKYNKDDLDEVPLTGVAHDPVFTSEDMTIRIPVYGKDDMVVVIPEGWRMVSCEFEPDYPRPDGTHGPSLVFVMSNGTQEEEVVVNAEPLITTYQGGETNTATIHVEGATRSITADIKLSSVANNAIQVDNEGLLVNISGKVDKQDIRAGYVLVADGLGGFTLVDPGVDIATSGILADLDDYSLPVAKVISDGIQAAIAAATFDIESRLSAVEDKVAELERDSVGPGTSDKVVVTTTTGVTRSDYIIGDDVLSDSDIDALATEKAVKDVASWKNINS